ncbi:hypothetical protein [Dyadobacter frigoris]|uniref:Uncharacterized protein n=1 Tax=Dyadobacter frigoris TaxID=2576211 RepID=A0A4U6D9I0_9BACT|nr:hypothetical protein [Dyadobacter frigoris]TKT93305.1 hypothetical protein FDK13_05485 [Dyadobacter frigoris]
MSVYTEEELQKVIDESFGGNKRAYYEAAAKSKREIISFQDLVAAETVLPHLTDSGHELINFYLGYIPDNFDTLPQEAFIRTVVYQFKNGSITKDELFEQAAIHIKEIRNNVMKEHLQEGFDFETYQDYESFHPEYRFAVSDRLKMFMGYEPNLEHSVKVELMLRQQMANDLCYFPDDEMTSLDIQAVSIIKYRKILLTDGKAAADASPLLVDTLLKN